MGIVLEAFFGVWDAHICQEVHTPFAYLGRACVLMDRDGFGDLVPNGKYRIERGHGFLKDHGYLSAANISHLPFAQVQEISPPEQHPAAHDFAGRAGDKAED